MNLRFKFEIFGESYVRIGLKGTVYVPKIFQFSSTRAFSACVSCTFLLGWYVKIALARLHVSGLWNDILKRLRCIKGTGKSESVDVTMWIDIGRCTVRKTRNVFFEVLRDYRVCTAIFAVYFVFSAREIHHAQYLCICYEFQFMLWRVRKAGLLSVAWASSTLQLLLLLSFQSPIGDFTIHSKDRNQSQKLLRIYIAVFLRVGFNND